MKGEHGGAICKVLILLTIREQVYETKINVDQNRIAIYDIF